MHLEQATRIISMLQKALMASTFAIATTFGVHGALAQDAKIQFEHVMNIGSEGNGEGQFKYVEDFAFSKDGHLLATDAAHAWVQASTRPPANSSPASAARAMTTSISTSPRASRSIRTATSSSPTTTPASSRNTSRLQVAADLQRIRLGEGPEHEVGVHGYP